MNTSIDEFRTRVRALPAAQNRLNDLRGMAQEAPRMAALTGDPNWDFFARYIEAQIKAAERLIETKRQQAAALVLLDEPKAKAAAVMVTALEARRDTLTELILLPRWILENGEAAKKLVAELEASV